MDLSEIGRRDGFGVARHPWELSRVWFVERLLKSVQSSQGQPLRNLMDVGCGDAFVSTVLASRFDELNIHAVDPALTPQRISQFSDDIGLDNLHLYPSLDDFASEEQSVELTLLLDVLEHVEDDQSLLQSLVSSPSQKPDSHFLITVPAMQSLYSTHDELLGHYRRYSLPQITTTARSSGLRVLESGYCFLSGFWVRLAEMMLERTRLRSGLRQTQVSQWNGGRRMTSLATALLRMDLITSRALSRIHLKAPGLSCYLVCQKPV
jgi:hypothetical protein